MVTALEFQRHDVPLVVCEDERVRSRQDDRRQLCFEIRQAILRMDVLGLLLCDPRAYTSK